VPDHDVIVLGAGPAGATAATLLAKRGVRVLMLDRGAQPNTHLPETWRYGEADLFARLGVDNVEEAFIESAPVSFYDASGQHGLRVTVEALSTTPATRLVHLDRSRFDWMLVENAIRSGVQYAPLHTVTRLHVQADRLTDVTCQTPSGQRTCSAELFIDASGKSALVASHFGLKASPTELDPRVAVFSHYVGGDFATICGSRGMAIVGIEHGYIFLIPVSDERVSVGVVVGKKAAAVYQGDNDALFDTELSCSPLVRTALASARKVLPTIPVLNVSYICERASGPGYLLIGEAAAFLDPFYSNGISIALRSAELAAETAEQLLASRDPSRCEALARSFDARFFELLETRRGEGWDWFRDGIGKTLALGCADPHLPALVPVALLGRCPTGRAVLTPEQLDLRPLIRAARDNFAAL
jgi:flavin-dependent dehydrogenase